MADMHQAEKYPEHQRLKAIAAESQAIGEFLEWLGDQELVVCRREAATALSNWQEYIPTRKPIRQLLADYFGIGQRKIDAEKDAMLCRLQRAAIERSQRGHVEGSDEEDRGD